MTPDIRRKAVLWLALVFTLAAAAGGVFGYGLARRGCAASYSSKLSEPERRARRVAEMTGEVGLTPEQASKVDAVILHAHETMKTLHEKFDSDVESLRMDARSQIRAFLTEDQLPKYEAFVRKIDAERKKSGQSPYGH